MTTYTVTVQEHSNDLNILLNNQYQLQVAKSVSSPKGDPIFKVVYTSNMLAPNMNISWKVQYGLNWATKVPAPGAKVEYSGVWQACGAGQSYNLNSVGEWVVNDNDPNAD
ncbi:hypothetical protein MFIFM68171_02099 [Madurella fahalii]|uniref:Uncharacterized protein n=1 Tax=Madurella fahalii TaxID=1157608 RepID=A0ABQ0G2E5_9PEZI